MLHTVPSLDIHVGISADTPACWVAQCLGSIRYAMSRAHYPITLQTLPGVPRHIGRMRQAGYALGTSEYATYVDDDDYLLPQAFERIGVALALHPEAIFPAEYHLQNGQVRLGNQRHHLPVYHRDQLLDHSIFRVCGDVAQIEVMRQSAVIDIEEPLYVHRLYDSKARILRRLYPHEYPQSLVFCPT